MLTTTHVREMMSDSLRSPHDLAARLGLIPNTSQGLILDRFAAGEEPLKLIEVRDENTVKAVALCALWRLLSVQGSACNIISSSRRMSAEFMEFLHKITTSIDPALTSVCDWTRWNVLQVGVDVGYQLRLVSNNPKWVSKPPMGVTTLVILGAASSSTKFCATREVFEAHAPAEDVRLITIW